MTSYIYIISNGSKSILLYWSGVEGAESKPMPRPPAGLKETGKGKTIEALYDPADNSKNDKVEGGLYKSTLEPYQMSAKVSVQWLIEADGRDNKANAVVGHAQLLKGAGGIQNPPRFVVQVLRGDGKAMGESGFKCIYYMKVDFEA